MVAMIASFAELIASLASLPASLLVPVSTSAKVDMLRP
jgi:hypothetical protein